MLRDAILQIIAKEGPMRGTDAEYAEVFSCGENEARDALQSLVDDQILVRARGIHGSANVYSLNKICPIPQRKTYTASSSWPEPPAVGALPYWKD